MKKLFVATLLFILLAPACTGYNSPLIKPTQPPAEITKVRLPMGYIPNVQYAPFYMAMVRGYFVAENIELEFDYSYETDGVSLVGANSLPFSLASGEQVLLARAQGLPVVYVFGWWQDYPVGVTAFSGQNIRAPADLRGKKIGLPGPFGASYIGLRALLNVADLQEGDVTLDSIGFNQIEALVSGQDQAVVIYANNEPIQLAAEGYELDLIRVADYVQLASNGLITNETVLVQNPELVRKMVRAISHGVADVLADPNEAYEYCLPYVEGLAQSDERIQKQVLEASIEFWRAERIGFTDPLAWENMQKVLLDMGLITQEMDLLKAYSNEFLYY